jgi:V/A-type H+-transporting ATPase subunit A
MSADRKESVIVRINGPVVMADAMGYASLGDQVKVGHEELTGEIIGLADDVATIQVYENTIGIKPGEPVVTTGVPLSVTLGPGILKSIYDGIQRPLHKLQEQSGRFIGRGLSVPGVDFEAKWQFTPTVKIGDSVSALAVLGEIPETSLITHRVMVPHGVSGEVVWIAEAGEYQVTDVIARVKSGSGEEKEITIMQRWAIRHPRPVAKRLPPRTPMITGQRVIDFLFPAARGGACAIPGGFGTGKTVTQHQLAKWSDVDIIVYVGCGERGNEMTQVLDEFPALIYPRTKKPLMERTTLIANTSNMPVTAREASIYTGLTLAEYYRDMGYNVAMMADSSSRWAEALREISGRLEEMPAEEGYPAYLASRIGEVYERAGRVVIGEGEHRREGSVTIIGAVSPPGGDFSEPVVTHTKRFVRTFWGLDRELARARHFPSINWLTSYSEYDVSEWWEDKSDLSWKDLREQAMALLKEDERLQNIVKLIGPDALPDRQRIVLETSRMIKEGFLQQSAFSDVDSYCPAEKQLAMMDTILYFHEQANAALAAGRTLQEFISLPVIDEIYRMKEAIGQTELDEFDKLKSRIKDVLAE